MPRGVRRNTAGTIKKIRKRYHEEGATQRELAKEFDIPSSNINLIVHDRIFKWVTDDTPDHMKTPGRKSLTHIKREANKKRRKKVAEMQQKETIPDHWLPAIKNSKLLLPNDCVRRLRELCIHHHWLVSEASRFFGINYQRLVKIIQGKSYAKVT